MASRDDHASAAFDAGVQHLADVYAKALLGAADKQGNTEQVLEEFDSLLEDVLDQLPQLRAALDSLRLDREEKEQLLDTAFRDRMSGQLLIFLKVVARHGRLALLRPIHRAAWRLYNERHGRVEVELRTAEPINGELLEQVTSRLEAALGRKVEARTSVDPDLIGGVVVRVGDTVYDGSIANQLVHLRQETLNRTVQAMRESLERFEEGRTAS